MPAKFAPPEAKFISGAAPRESHSYLSVRMPVSLHERLRDASQWLPLSINQIVVQAIEARLVELERKAGELKRVMES